MIIKGGFTYLAALDPVVGNDIAKIRPVNNFNILSLSTCLFDTHAFIFWNNKDPFDRLLIAQANQNNFRIVAKDQDIQK